VLACTETVTFVRLVKGADSDTYEKHVFSGVSWYNKTRIRTENAGVVYDNAVQIRIPAAAITTQALPAVGDYVIHGELPAGTQITKRADLEAYAPRKVMAVGDNRRGGLPHVAVIGQ